MVRTRTCCRFLCTIIALAIFLAVPASADTGDSSSKDINYDHSSGKSKSYHRSLKDGEQLTISIKNTAKECFDFGLEKVPLDGPEAGTLVTDLTRTHTMKIDHDPQYGGYILRITRHTRNLPPICDSDDAARKLKSVTLIVSVENEGIEVAFGGGFTISDLTNPVFATRQNSMGQDILIEDESAEDDYDLGVAAFIHVYGKGWRKWAPTATFGLGISESSKTTFYVGPFWRLGKQAFLGGGAVFGSVDRLPAGVRPGDVVTNQNTLNNLGSKTEVGAFIGFSYTFLGNKAVFEKPFQSVEKKAEQTDSTQPSTSSNSGLTDDQKLQNSAEGYNKFLSTREDNPVTKVELSYSEDKKTVLVKPTIEENTPPLTDEQKKILLESLKQRLESDQVPHKAVEFQT